MKFKWCNFFLLVLEEIILWFLNTNQLHHKDFKVKNDHQVSQSCANQVSNSYLIVVLRFLATISSTEIAQGIARQALLSVNAQNI